jgi:hypothetical protein
VRLELEFYYNVDEHHTSGVKTLNKGQWQLPSGTSNRTDRARTKCAVRLWAGRTKSYIRANMAATGRGKTNERIEAAHARQVTTHM